MKKCVSVPPHSFPALLTCRLSREFKYYERVKLALFLAKTAHDFYRHRDARLTISSLARELAPRLLFFALRNGCASAPGLTAKNVEAMRLVYKWYCEPARYSVGVLGWIAVAMCYPDSGVWGHIGGLELGRLGY